jgi:hypothetical protein
MRRALVIMIMASLIFVLSAEKKFYNVDGLRKLSTEDLKRIKEMPKFDSSRFRNAREIPVALDNSELDFFPPIMNQEGGSCGQASGVYYNFTYEMNRARGTAASDEEHQYPSHFTWNYINQGMGYGSWPFEGWDIIDKVGCPTIETYGGYFAEGGDTRWMSGYAEYRESMENRIENYMTIDVSTVEGLTNFKQWMTDKGQGDETGGIANFGAGVSPVTIESIPSGTPHQFESIITEWSPGANHAMTFVGFDDSVRYDLNNDGQFTNDIDINNDGVVDLQDYEIGAVIVANSWGEWWENGGYCYMMYRLLAVPIEEGGIANNLVFVLNGRSEYTPKLGLRADISYNKRKNLRLMAGISLDVESDYPEYQIDFPVVNFQGGDHGMSGENNEIEIELDMTHFSGMIPSNQDVKFFLMIQENDPLNNGSGQINRFSIVDYQDGNFEVPAEQYEVPIENNDITVLSLVAPFSGTGLEITNDENINVTPNEEFEIQLNAINGTEPYIWNILKEYDEVEITVDNELAVDDTWTEIATANTDDSYAVFDFPFTFNFYGKDYDQAVVVTDGSIIFDAGGYASVRTLGNLKSQKAIVPFGKDLQSFPEYNEGIFYKVIDDELWIQWKTSEYDNPGANYHFAAVLNQNSDIKFVFGNNLSDETNFVSGISDGSEINFQISSANFYNQIPDNFATEWTSNSDYEAVNLTEDGLFTGSISEVALSEYKVLVTDFDHVSSLKTFKINTGVANDDIASFDNLRIISCYPNPFSNKRSETSIAFEINSPQIVGLEIFNIKGQKVKSISQKCEAGINEIRWNGKDAKANDVTSGVYFYKVSTSNNEKFGKILRVK